MSRPTLDSMQGQVQRLDLATAPPSHFDLMMEELMTSWYGALLVLGGAIEVTE